MEHPFLMFLDHTQRRSIVGRTPLDEWSARRRDLYLTTHDTHNRQISMPRWDSNPRSQQVSGRRPLTCWETSRIGAPYIYNVRLLRVNAFPERISPLSTHFGSCNAKCVVIIFKERDFRDSISENLHDLWENIAYYSQHTSPVLKGERQL